MRFVDIILEILGWLQITFGITIISALVAFGLYWALGERIKTVAIGIVVIGLVIGIVCATSIWKRYGTIAWLSRIRRIS